MTKLLMDRFASKCENCGKGADPSETGHYTVIAYINGGTPGCGEMWTSWVFPYVITKEWLDKIYHDHPNLRTLPSTVSVIDD